MHMVNSLDAHAPSLYHTGMQGWRRVALQLIAAREQLCSEALVAEARLGRLRLCLAHALTERRQCEAALLLAVLVVWEQHQPQPLRTVLCRALLQHGLVGEAAEKARGQDVLRLEVHERANKVGGGTRRHGGSGGGGARGLGGSYFRHVQGAQKTCPVRGIKHGTHIESIQG